MPVDTTGATIFTSASAMWAMFLASVPKILGFILILVAGWIIASLIQKAVAALLRTVHFNNLARRAGISDFVQRMGLETDASGFIGAIAKWFVRLIALIVAFDALGLPAVSSVLRQLLLWLPNLVVAIVVLVIGGIAANALASVVRASTEKANFSNPGLVSKVARVAVWAFAIVVAVNQLGIAETLINTLFMATVGAMALAFGLAFGLGGRDTAAEIWRRAYLRSQEAAPKIARASEEAANMAGEPGRDVTPPFTPPRNQPGTAFGDD